MRRGWHIYWKRPGDAGLGTAVELKVPKGFAAGPIRWPRPVTFKQPGDITGYGYKGEVLLVAKVTAPKNLKPGTAVPIGAEVSWLACKDKCVPGEKKVSVTLAAAANPRPANERLFAAWLGKLPPRAKEFELLDQEGRRVSLRDLLGKVVVLEWFNPDCPFVKRHHVSRKTMVTLARKYSDKGVVWLAVNSTHYMDRPTSKRWHDTWKLPYPVLIDRDGKVGRAYAAKTTPHMFVIDRDGSVAYEGAIDSDPRGRAKSSENYVDTAITDLLAGRPVSTPRTRSYGCSVKYAR